MRTDKAKIVADIVDAKTRSRMMSGIGTRNTKPELVVRHLLFQQGFRYRLHRHDLPGRPDLVLPSYRVAVLVNGCFWHLHGCDLFKWPRTNRSFWKKKLEGNRDRDQRVQSELKKAGWHVMVVWECATRRKSENQLMALGKRMGDWIRADSSRMRCRNFR